MLLEVGGVCWHNGFEKLQMRKQKIHVEAFRDGVSGV